MIASVKGVVEYVAADHVIISVGGVGLQIFVPTSTLSTIGTAGTTVHLCTQMVVREDAITLFGFNNNEDLRFFQLLLGVSGVGPKLAMTMLSAMSAGELTSAITGDSIELLTSVPGIGKKLAGRLILELKDKLAAGGGLPLGGGDGDVIAALLALGYSASEASHAVAAVPRDTTLGTEDKIKLALGYFEQ